MNQAATPAQVLGPKMHPPLDNAARVGNLKQMSRGYVAKGSGVHKSVDSEGPGVSLRGMQQKELLSRYLPTDVVDSRNSNENHRHSVQTGSTLRGHSDGTGRLNTSTCQNSYNLRYHNPRNNDLCFN